MLLAGVEVEGIDRSCPFRRCRDSFSRSDLLGGIKQREGFNFIKQIELNKKL
jgi:hypothetical protein